MMPYHARVLEMRDDRPHTYIDNAQRDGYETNITDAEAYIIEQQQRAKRLLRKIGKRQHLEARR
jgi:hypothetical protein